MVDSGINRSTVISGGLLNPVILKRFTIAWMAYEHMGESLSFYRELAKKLSISIMTECPILRIMSSVEEQNNWVVASDKKQLSPFLSSEIQKNDNPNIKAPFGFGKVNHSARIFPSVLLAAYREYLQKQDSLLTETFDYDQLTDHASEANNVSDTLQGVSYKGVSAKRIVFAEGTNALHNPFFPKHYLIPNKGEYLIIKAPELQLDEMIKGPIFIIPLGEQLFKVGATYSRNDETHHTTEDAKEQLCKKLEKMISCDYEVVSQMAGIRPTTKDRRPLMGMLPESSNKAYFNGLGSHGIMGAPFLSKILYEHLENGMELPKEMDIRRWL